jgi:hypothetical protein
MSDAAATDASPGEPVTAAAVGTGSGEAECWCCGQPYDGERLVRLGSHPEVAVCLRCAHLLDQQARGRADALRPSIAGRVRGSLRSGRRLVVQRRWHQRPLIGRPLRWLGRHLP